VVQSVYKSFFARYQAGQFDLHSWDDLWSLLTVLTVRKCVNRIQYFRAQCRDIAQEASPGSRADALDVLRQALDPAPTPDEAAILTELIEQLLRGMSPDSRPIPEVVVPVVESASGADQERPGIPKELRA
jgi:RNA polymerase sigma-70 factor (ECF subfamily)